TGIHAATGEYVHFMDVDDLLTLDFYEKMSECALKTEADMACCGFFFERTPSHTQHVGYQTVVSTTEDKILMTNVSNYGACWRYIYKLSFLKKHSLLFEVGRLVEDRIFTIQAVYFANRIVMVPDAMYIYKHRKNAITTTKNTALIKKRHADRKYANQFQSEFAEKHQFSLDKSLNRRRWQYKLLGLPILTKIIYHAGKTRWYFLGIPVFQKKEIDT
ncbi:MAG: glycosyltransferase, partial [Bacteroidia bacterium]|nr:glycosyltransferase [Bacteroidia bacterium]